MTAQELKDYYRLFPQFNPSSWQFHYFRLKGYWEELKFYYRRISATRKWQKYLALHPEIPEDKKLDYISENPMTFKQAVEHLRVCYFPRRSKKQDKKLKSIVKSYFELNPDKFEEVKKATYAWHNPNLPFGHAFLNEKPDPHRLSRSPEIFNSTECRDAKCSKCGRTREQVRYDDLPAKCSVENEEMGEKIKTILRKESEGFIKLLSRAEKEAPKYIQKLGLSGKTLAYLHTTHGFPPESCVESWIFKAYEAEYEQEMEKERALSRSKQVKKVITVN